MAEVGELHSEGCESVDRALATGGAGGREVEVLFVNGGLGGAQIDGDGSDGFGHDVGSCVGLSTAESDGGE